MEQALKEFALAIEDMEPRLRDIDERASLWAPAPGKWTRKEVLGHLIDSASNNHARFVRAQLTENPAGPGYEQDGWVAVQRYREEPWKDLVDLWLAYNRHLLHVIANVRPEALDHQITIGAGMPVTLAFVMKDYVRHMKHHLAQIFASEMVG